MAVAGRYDHLAGGRRRLWTNVPPGAGLCTCPLTLAGGSWLLSSGPLSDADHAREEPWTVSRCPPRGRPGPVEPPTAAELATTAELAGYVVAAAVWAPSVHNTQPWWFSASGREISLYADAGRQLAVADPRGREMLISCGAALFTARLALRSLGPYPRDLRAARPGPAAAGRPAWAAPAGGGYRV